MFNTRARYRDVTFIFLKLMRVYISYLFFLFFFILDMASKMVKDKNNELVKMREKLEKVNKMQEKLKKQYEIKQQLYDAEQKQLEEKKEKKREEEQKKRKEEQRNQEEEKLREEQQRKQEEEKIRFKREVGNITTQPPIIINSDDNDEPFKYTSLPESNNNKNNHNSTTSEPESNNNKNNYNSTSSDDDYTSNDDKLQQRSQKQRRKHPYHKISNIDGETANFREAVLEQLAYFRKEIEIGRQERAELMRRIAPESSTSTNNISQSSSSLLPSKSGTSSKSTNNVPQSSSSLSPSKSGKTPRKSAFTSFKNDWMPEISRRFNDGDTRHDSISKDINIGFNSISEQIDTVNKKMDKLDENFHSFQQDILQNRDITPT